MISRGEEAAASVCGPDFVDPAVVVGAMKKLEEIKKGRIVDKE